LLVDCMFGWSCLKQDDDAGRHSTRGLVWRPWASRTCRRLGRARVREWGLSPGCNPACRPAA